MRIHHVTITLALALTAACGGDSPSLEQKLKQFTRQVCACKDEACADAVDEKVVAYIGAAFKDKKEAEVEKLIAKLDPLVDEFSACYERAAGHPPRD